MWYFTSCSLRGPQENRDLEDFYSRTHSANTRISGPLLRYVTLDELPINTLNDLVANAAKY